MSNYIVEAQDGNCCGPYVTLVAAQTAAAGYQAADVATDPSNLSSGTTTDALTYYVIETKQTVKNMGGVLFTNSSDRVFKRYVVKLLTP